MTLTEERVEVRATSLVTARTVSRSSALPATPPLRTVGKWQRRSVLLLVAMISALMTFWGVVAGPAPSAAFPDLNPVDALTSGLKGALCDAIGATQSAVSGQAYREPYGFTLLGAAGVVTAAPTAIRMGAVASGSLLTGDGPHTAWEFYGSSGLNWVTYFGAIDNQYLGNADNHLDGDCIPIVPMTQNAVANLIFGFAKVTTTITLSIFSWLSDDTLLDGLFSPINSLIIGGTTCAVDDPTTPLNESLTCYQTTTGLRDSLFIQFIQPMIVIAAIWMLWSGLIKKRTREAAQGAIWTIFAVSFGLVFLNQPMFFVDLANNFVTTANGIFINATTSSALTSPTPPPGGDICWLPGSAPNAGSRAVTCSLYKTFLFVPWATGQYGVSSNYPLPNDLGPGYTYMSGPKEGQPIPVPKIVPSDRFPGLDDIRVTQLNAQVIDHDDLICLLPTNPKQCENLLEDPSAEQVAVRDQVLSSPWALNWSARGGAGDRITVAILAVVASMIGGAVMLIFSFYALLLSVGMLLLVLVSPLFLTMGIVPGFGRRVALRWMETTLGVVLKRVIIGFLLAILTGLYAVILGSTQFSWLAQVVLICAVGFAAIMYRKQFIQMMNFINLGGGGGDLGQAPPQMRQASRRAGASAVAGAGGGVGAIREGGVSPLAVLGGVAAGAMMGSRGRPGPRTFNMGQRSAAAKQRAKNAKEAREERESNGPAAAPRPTPPPRTAPTSRPEPQDDGNVAPRCGTCGQPMTRSGNAWTCRNVHSVPTTPPPPTPTPAPGPLLPTSPDTKADTKQLLKEALEPTTEKIVEAVTEGQKFPPPPPMPTPNLPPPPPPSNPRK